MLNQICIHLFQNLSPDLYMMNVYSDGGIMPDLIKHPALHKENSDDEK